VYELVIIETILNTSKVLVKFWNKTTVYRVSETPHV